MGKIEALTARLAGQRVYVDANVFIYFLDRNETYFAAVAAFFQACLSRNVFACTSDLAIAEVMVMPYRSDDAALVAQFKSFFSQKNFLSICELKSDVFDAAAMLAGRKNMKLFEALHVATALHAGCRFLITNDAGIRSSGNLQVILLADLIKSPS